MEKRSKKILMMPYCGPIGQWRSCNYRKTTTRHAAQAAADALRAVTCDPTWPRGYCTLGDALLRLGSPLEALEAFLDGARVARDAGRLEDAFELDRKGRDARATRSIMRRPVCR